MPWVKIDDHFDEHPKLARVGPLGWGIWLAGLAYCNRNLTDGFIPRAVAHSLADFQLIGPDNKLYTLAQTCGMQGNDVDAEWVIGFLLEAGLWKESYQGEAFRGYQIHDYDHYQPSREAVLADREAARERQARSREKSRRVSHPQSHRNNDVTRDSVTPPPVPVPDSVPENPDQEPSSPIGDIDAEFDEFWSSYPKRNGKKLDKGKADSAWKRLNNAERERAQVAVAHYATACDSGVTIAKDAFRWLRDRAFNDWQEPATPSTNGHHPYRDSDQWTAAERGLE